MRGPLAFIGTVKIFLLTFKIVTKMKTKLWIFALAMICASFSLISSCSKDDDDSHTVKDIDGNVYHTVTIGTQVWIVENLNVTKYNDGTEIPHVFDNDEWRNLTTGAYCNYDNYKSNASIYGRLYNWYALNTGKLCPKGWHVPSSAEWYILKEYLTNNGYGYEGSGDDIAKSLADTSGWRSSDKAGDVGNDQASNNSSGFSGLPGGNREPEGMYSFMHDSGYWWSISESEYNTSSAYIRRLFFLGDQFEGWSLPKKYGLSVRCIKD